MSVRRSEVDRIAALANLSLSDAEADRLTVELSGILDHIVALGTDDETSPLPSSHDDDRDATTRPDRSLDPLASPPASFAPDWRDGFFAVPRLPALGEASAAGSGDS